MKNLIGNIVRHYKKGGKSKVMYKRQKRGKGPGVIQYREPAITDLSTPLLSDRHQHYTLSHQKTLIKHFNIKEPAKPIYPEVPSEDPREVNHSKWNKLYKPLVLDALRKFQVDVDVWDLKTIESHQKELHDEININLVVDYLKDEDAETLSEQEAFYRSVFLGNYIEMEMIKDHKPKIHFENPNENDLYTLVALSPDFPFRLQRDSGNFTHWVVTNLNGNNEGDEVVKYLPPLPQECAGLNRIVFMLFKQSGKVDPSESSTAFENRSPSTTDLIDPSKRSEKLSMGSDLQPEIVENPQDLTSRRSLLIPELQSILNLPTQFPSGIVFFSTEHDFSVYEYCKESSIQEYFYLPPDLEYEHDYHIHNRHDKKLHHQQWL
mmetsp:Transcript_9133/g.13502  ORF Transcript_9133/g.13502 Transcript_9133/m.13502 type:complete len:377 (+) Transcript_9133:29-1159(+)